MKVPEIILVSVLALDSTSISTGESSAPSFRGRRLNFDFLGGYQPATLIVDHAAIDLDQAEMERLLADERKLDAAKAVYERGGYSLPIARMTLKNPGTPPAEPIPAGTIVVGKNRAGNSIQGRLMEAIQPWQAGDNKTIVLNVAYQGFEDGASPVDCRIGGLEVEESGANVGCFADTGTISLLDLMVRETPTYEFEYEYRFSSDNINGITLKKFSEVGQDEMWNCGDNCPYKDYAKFIRYYQHFDYGDQWIQASFSGEPTDFKFGNADFSVYQPQARAASVRVATKLMNVWMYVVRMMEHSIDQCEKGCVGGRDDRCDDSPVRAWDQAVAFYVGSLEGDSGVGRGVLLYDLADEMCAQFRTCGSDATMHTGSSYVNNEVIKAFQEGQGFMLRRECESGKERKKQIVKLMTIPLIQATLQMAYNQRFFLADTDELAAIDEAKGAAVAASVLPLVHDCNKEHAATIYENMKVKTDGDLPVDFRAVQVAFEQTYECLGVSCDTVGGYWKHTNHDYAFMASPCRGVEDEETEQKSGIVWIVVSGVGAVFAVSLLLLYYTRDRREEIRPEFHDGPQINVGVSFD